MLSVIAVLVFTLCVVMITLFGYKISTKTAEDYMLANRALGVIVMFFFITFGAMSSWTALAFPGTMYIQGPGFGIFASGVMIGNVLMVLVLGPRLSALSTYHNYISPLEAVGDRYESRFIRTKLAIVNVIFLIPLIAIMPLSAGLVMEYALGIPTIYGIIYLSVIMLVIVLIGGMRSVAWVNVFLGIVVLVAVTGSFFWVISVTLPGGLSEAAATLAQINPSQLGVPGPLKEHTPMVLLSFFIIGAGTSTYYSTTLATMGAKSVTLFKWIGILTFLVIGPLLIILIIFGSLVAPAILPGLTGLQADSVLQVVVARYLPEWMSVLFCIGIIAAAISTAAYHLLALAGAISRDIVFVIKKEVDGPTLILATRIILILVVIASFLGALRYEEQIAYASLLAIFGVFLWMPAIWFGLLWRGATKWGVIVGFFTALVYFVAGQAFPAIFVIEIPILVVIAQVAVTYLVSLVTPKSSSKVLTKFFDDLDKHLVKPAN